MNNILNKLYFEEQMITMVSISEVSIQIETAKLYLKLRYWFLSQILAFLRSLIMAHSLIACCNILFQIHQMEPDTNVRTKYCRNCKNRINMMNFDVHSAQCQPPPKPPRIRAPKKEKKNKNQSVPQINASKPEDSDNNEDLFPCYLCGQSQTLAELDSHPRTCPNRQVKCNYCSSVFPTCIIDDHKAICPNKPRVLPVPSRAPIPSAVLSSVQNGNNSQAVIRVPNVRPAALVPVVAASNSSQSISTAVNRNPLSVQQRPQHRVMPNNMFIPDMPASDPNNLPNIFARPQPPSEQLPRREDIPHPITVQERLGPFWAHRENPRQYIRPPINRSGSQEGMIFSRRPEMEARTDPNHIVQPRIANRQNERLRNMRNEAQSDFARRMAILDHEFPNRHIINVGASIRELANRQVPVSNPRGMSTQEIARIPEKRYCKKQKEESQNCSICVCQFLGNQVVKDLPCRHLYHTNCIGQWLAISTACPLCKCDLSKLVRQSQEQRSVEERSVPEQRVTSYSSYSRYMFAMGLRNVIFREDDDDDGSEE